MKTSKILITLGMLLLAACGSDSSKSSGKNNFTGSKSDIEAAKKLVGEYDNNNVFFEKGYISYDYIKNNTLTALTYLSYAADYKTDVSSYFAMRHVGCLRSDGSTIFTEQNQHTQMDLLVGEQSARAIYIQANKIDRCYLGSIGVQGQYSVNGNIRDYIDRSRGILPLPSKLCRDLKAEQALVRIAKSNFDNDHDRSNSNQSNNYWGYRSRWNPDKDYYYEVKNNRYGIYNYQTQEGSSEEDSFANLGNSEAVFVSKSIRSRSTNPSCVKDVYWGFEIDPNLPPQIQILGRNSTGI